MRVRQTGTGVAHYGDGKRSVQSGGVGEIQTEGVAIWRFGKGAEWSREGFEH